MPYQPIELGSLTPPLVRDFIERKLDRHFLIPARELFKLPRSGCPASANFGAAITNILVDVVSGISTLTMGADGKRSGYKFKEILRTCFPWDQEPAPGDPAENIELLYESFRNPLAHALRIGPNGEQVKIISPYRRIATGAPRGLYESEIIAIEKRDTRDPAWRRTIVTRSVGATLSLVGMYWGVRTMIKRATQNQDLMVKADEQLSRWKHW